ncbi:related to DPP1 - diacylglycerol pyrophosphate phosphatase [Pseudozyma flocculosa]|nr:related to DPP1 - diacylglycerol pyrophosphate phosphatase [Pseudozyma flocculosa]
MYAQNQNGNDGTADQHQHQHVHVGPAAGVNGGQHIPSASKLPGGDLYRTLRWSRQRPPMTRERKLLLLRSYLPDWIITIVLAGLLALINNVHGFRREFSLTDTSIQHTFATSERVPMWLLGVSAVIVPALIIAGVALGVSRSVWDLHNGLLGFVLAHCLNVTATTIIKVCVGRPRPDLIDRCQPRPGSANAQPYGLATDAICSVGVDNSELRDGFRSFPSGHASSAFAGLTFLSLYLAAKMHLFDRRGHAISAWLTLTPMLGAVLIAVSRTMDYRHHATDVIAGGILGFVMAFSVYRLYFPPLSHPLCHKPYSPRIPREGMFSTGAGYDEGDVEENASELDDSPRHQHRHHHHHHHHRHHGADTAAAVGGDGAGGATTTTTYGGAPGAGTHSRQGSDARMLDATKGVVQAYERDPSPVHGAKASLEDDYVPETVNRV